MQTDIIRSKLSDYIIPSGSGCGERGNNTNKELDYNIHHEFRAVIQGMAAHYDFNDDLYKELMS